jgi:plasmid maintenance system killer protein
VQIRYVNRKLQKQCGVLAESVRKWGSVRASRVRLRVTQLSAASCLADLMTLNGADCHPLHGNRSGQFAVDAKYPYRLIFVPDHNPLPTLADGGLNLSKVVKIKIIEVVDYHGQ